MKILVTGGAGFIGSNFLDFIINNKMCSEIVVIDNLITGAKDNIKHLMNSISFVEADFSEVTTAAFLKENQFDAIFHFAALPRIQPSYVRITEHHNANVTKVLHLIENLIIANCFDTKFIYSSSSAIYGNPDSFPTKEDAVLCPLSPYAFQKLEVENYLILLSEYYKDLKWTALRYFNPYGPRSFSEKNKDSAYSSVIGIFLNRKKKNQILQITGDGEQRRDFIHVSDVASANWLSFVNYKDNQHYNVGTGVTHSINEVARMISDKFEYVVERKGEAQTTHADNSKIINDLNWNCKKELMLGEVE